MNDVGMRLAPVVVEQEGGFHRHIERGERDPHELTFLIPQEGRHKCRVVVALMGSTSLARLLRMADGPAGRFEAVVDYHVTDLPVMGGVHYLCMVFDRHHRVVATSMGPTVEAALAKARQVLAAPDIDWVDILLPPPRNGRGIARRRAASPRAGSVRNGRPVRNHGRFTGRAAA